MSKQKILNVFYEDILVGKLTKDQELIFSFTYSKEWLEYSQSFQLSLAMPLSPKPFGNKITLSFFENLLPEGEAKDALEKSQQLIGVFDFLKEYGIDCAGAVILSQNKRSPFTKPCNQKVRIEMKKIFKAIDQKRSVVEVIAEMNPGYLSIAGAQDKFAAIYKDGDFYLPKNGGPSTHIIKVPIYRSGVKESVYNEYYCMKLAKRVGLNIPEIHVLDHESHPLYIIKRYDRIQDDTQEYKRIHQQDFCQAQGLVSESKYENKGGPTLKDNYEIIKNNVTIKARSQALFDYIDWFCFNFLIGNNDSHSKNLSLLLKDGRIELAPFYDLLCTAIYPKLKKDFSFMLGDRSDASRIGKNQLEIVDGELGLKVGTTSERMLGMKNKLLKEKDQLVAEIQKELPAAKIPKRISQLIEKRCASLEKQGITK